jgi:3'-phosphoadenosine 5'-phosphosulfate sulfotransferase (PAPS reductase)/FAD synthetase
MSDKGLAVASISYGKDSLAMLEVIHRHGLPLDRILHAEVWATPTIPGDLPEMVEFKDKADKIILDRYGIKVERVRAKRSFEEQFYMVKEKGTRAGTIYGWPYGGGMWCNGALKVKVLGRGHKNAKAVYVGIAADEPERIKRLTPPKTSPLAQFGYTERNCYEICEELGLLSPIYTSHLDRGGCWFCPKQRISELKKLKTEYPELWEKMMEWESAWEAKGAKEGSFLTRYTLRYFDERFDAEESQISLLEASGECND